MTDPLARLTDKQRACLRLVYAHMSSKEIAPRLGVEPNTVDQYVKAAMRILGVSDRRAAARMLAQYEAADGQLLVYQPLGIAGARQPAILAPSTERRPEAALGGAMREEAMPFHVAVPGSARLRLPFAAGEGRNDLGWMQRLAWIVFISILGAVAYFGLVEAARLFLGVAQGFRAAI